MDKEQFEKAIALPAGTQLDMVMEGVLGIREAIFRAAPYSAEMQWAWLVVEHMRNLGWTPVIRAISDITDTWKKKWTCEFQWLEDAEPMICRGIGYVNGDLYQWSAKDESAPLAICRAAITCLHGRELKLLEIANGGKSSSTEGEDSDSERTEKSPG